jgi:hypothetical protein
LAILICVASCGSQKTSKPIPLQLTASLGGIGSLHDTIGVIYISTTLHNLTNDTVRFISMSCSYEDFFTTNTDLFKVQSRYDCYSNYPIVIILPPKSRTDRYIIITAPQKGKKVDIDKLKIGMHSFFVEREITTAEITNLYEHRQDAGIVWTDELDLKRLNKINY